MSASKKDDKPKNDCGTGLRPGTKVLTVKEAISRGVKAPTKKAKHKEE